jgi:hypothetical protein
MTSKDDILRMAKEADLNVHDPAIELLQRFAALVAAAERNKLAAWMQAQGYATGHGDTVEDLLKELEWQIRESEREACAKVCDELDKADETFYRELSDASVCAATIRARGQA